MFENIIENPYEIINYYDVKAIVDINYKQLVQNFYVQFFILISFLLKDYIFAVIPVGFLVLLKVHNYLMLLIDTRSEREIKFEKETLIKTRLELKQWIIGPIFWTLEIISLILRNFKNSEILLIIPIDWLVAIIHLSDFQLTIMAILFINTFWNGKPYYIRKEKFE